ncbi:predicted protein [Histoplasma capsulatum var. duboisii H88]|uniref:Predicted protein n=2 Tax=Ajellomyces capsulatus TaxID=5037 RepID=F0U5R2_AJEC8|nr:predicted protein [Histoplasma capsulatum H143]EGC41357.1 predicted protein [Histoplasma capsulatum var. duboisii H88]
MNVEDASEPAIPSVAGQAFPRLKLVGNIYETVLKQAAGVFPIVQGRASTTTKMPIPNTKRIKLNSHSIGGSFQDIAATSFPKSTRGKAGGSIDGKRGLRGFKL